MTENASIAIPQEGQMTRLTALVPMGLELVGKMVHVRSVLGEHVQPYDTRKNHQQLAQ